ncbi:MAG: flippase-like domain-containing protein, partial [Ignavibacteriae bacterium]|nr:flippase-like domain-containing protein [Ignavibacteriota bacterium]
FFLFKSYLVASFFNHFLPSTVGGDSIRAYDSWKLGDNKEKAFAIVILDRFLGLFTLLIFAIIAMLYSPDLHDKIPQFWFWVFILSIGAATIIWFIFSPPTKFLNKIAQSNKGIVSKFAGIIYKMDVIFSEYVNKKLDLLFAFILSILLQSNVVFYYFAISTALGLPVVLIDYFLIVPLTIFITMIPISFNGIGLRESALFLFLSTYGVLQSEAIAFAWIEYGMLLLLGIIGGIIYSTRK